MRLILLACLVAAVSALNPGMRAAIQPIRVHFGEVDIGGQGSRPAGLEAAPALSQSQVLSRSSERSLPPKKVLNPPTTPLEHAIAAELAKSMSPPSAPVVPTTQAPQNVPEVRTTPSPYYSSYVRTIETPSHYAPSLLQAPAYVTPATTTTTPVPTIRSPYYPPFVPQSPPKSYYRQPATPNYAAAPGRHEFSAAAIPEQVHIPQTPAIATAQHMESSSDHLAQAHADAVRKLTALHEAAHAASINAHPSGSAHADATRNLALGHAAAVQQLVASHTTASSGSSVLPHPVPVTSFSISIPEHATEHVGSSAGHIPILRFDSEIHEGKLHAYSFEAGNGIKQDETTLVQFVPGTGPHDCEEALITKIGHVSYFSPEGQLIRLSYVADKDGFRPEGAHLPTPPPTPAEIQEGLKHQ